jgi:hypothetical protein
MGGMVVVLVVVGVVVVCSGLAICELPALGEELVVWW